MKNINFFVLTIISLFFFSCTDDSDYDFSGESENKVYIKSNNFTVNGYDKSVAQLIKTPIGLVYDGMSLQLPNVFSTFAAEDNIVLKFVADASLVDRYNASNKTEYQSFPEEWVTFQNNEIVISQNSTKGKGDVIFTLNEEKINEMNIGKYLLPLRIEKISGNAIVSENRNTYYFLIDVYQDDNIPDIEIPNTGELLTEDRTGWKVECFNSSFSGDISKLFDNQEGESLSYNLSSESGDKGFIVDMQKKYSDICGIYLLCYASFYMLNSIDIYSSLDKKSWELQGNYRASDAASTILFYNPIEAQYLKIVVKEVGRWGAYLTEFNVLQKN